MEFIQNYILNYGLESQKRGTIFGQYSAAQINWKIVKFETFICDERQNLLFYYCKIHWRSFLACTVLIQDTEKIEILNYRHYCFVFTVRNKDWCEWKYPNAHVYIRCIQEVEKRWNFICYQSQSNFCLLKPNQVWI